MNSCCTPGCRFAGSTLCSPRGFPARRSAGYALAIIFCLPARCRGPVHIFIEDIMTSPNTRQEKDSIGTKDIPADVYYGIQTARAMENYPISGMRAHPT